MQLVYPSLAPPILVVVGMLDVVVPGRNGSVQVAVVNVRERAEFAIPVVSVEDVEREMRIGILVGLFHNGVFERVTQAERAVTMEIVIHPLIGGRGLFGDSLERGMGM